MLKTPLSKLPQYGREDHEQRRRRVGADVVDALHVVFRQAVVEEHSADSSRWLIYDPTVFLIATDGCAMSEPDGRLLLEVLQVRLGKSLKKELARDDDERRALRKSLLGLILMTRDGSSAAAKDSGLLKEFPALADQFSATHDHPLFGTHTVGRRVRRYAARSPSARSRRISNTQSSLGSLWSMPTSWSKTRHGMESSSIRRWSLVHRVA